jgi:hypothetical protein
MPSDLEVLGEHLGKMAAERFDMEKKCQRLELEVERLKEELTRWKSTTVQEYVASCRSRTSSPEAVRQSAKKSGGIMAMLSRGSLPVTSKTGLPEELATRMHAILEETLMKNIQLQKDLSQLGEECASLQGHVHTLEQVAKDAGLAVPPRAPVDSKTAAAATAAPSGGGSPLKNPARPPNSADGDP